MDGTKFGPKCHVVYAQYSNFGVKPSADGICMLGFGEGERGVLPEDM